MEKLSHVEAQRVISVLGDALEQFACLARVPELASATIFQALETKNCTQVLNSLESQYQLEEALVVAQERRRSTDVLAQIEKRLRGNTRTLCRLLRDDHNANEVLEDIVAREEAKLADDGAPEYRISHMSESKADISGSDHDKMFVREVTSEALADCLAGLRNVVFRALTTTVEEEHAEKELLQNVATREHDAEEDRATLQSELAIARRGRNRTLSEMDAHIRKLEAELRDIKQIAEQEETNLANEIRNQRKELDDEHNKVCTELRTEEAKLTEELDKLTLDMEEKETGLAKKKGKAETEANAEIDKYDVELGAKKDQLDRLRELYDAEIKRVNQLEDHFDRVDTENARIAKEEEEWAKFVYEQTADDRARDYGAASIQKLFRGYQGRLLVQNMKKGKKGGKKK